VLVIDANNVNDAYEKAVYRMQDYGVREDSRNGPVIVSTAPVTTIYNRPTERVLFNTARRANPFFHFFECLWMMRGTDDAKWLDQFVGDFSSRYAEENGKMFGAYGYRWRNHFGYDQIAEVCSRLARDNKDRRVVIQMWDATCDLESSKHTKSGSPAKDVPCNTQLYPRIVDGRLDITVMCRSNDVVWGCYGANAVHFSFLQEYMAARIGVPVGRYYQISNNWHLYEAVESKFQSDNLEDYPGTYPIVQNWQTWDLDLSKFFVDPMGASYSNSFFLEVALPMWEAHRYHRQKRGDEAARWAKLIRAADWRKAVLQYIGAE
jgi:thymidylate synthase